MFNISSFVSVPESVPLDDDVLAALSNGFRQLEDPVPAPTPSLDVVKELTSGRDFDPWYRQIGRRAVWTSIPAVASFLLAYGALSLFTIPPMTPTHPSRNTVSRRDVPSDDALAELYRTPAPLGGEFNIRIESEKANDIGLAPPTWWKPIPKPASKTIETPAMTSMGMMETLGMNGTGGPHQ